MKKLRIMVLIREGLRPPESLQGRDPKEIAEWKVEYDVINTLRKMGHDVKPVEVYDDLSPIRSTILEWKPHIAFMLLEEFHGVGTYDQAIVSYLELMQQHYTGCNPRGLMLTHDKGLSKKIMMFHRIPTPRFALFPAGKKVRCPKWLKFPVMVKSTIEDASLGISQASIVNTASALVERVEFVHQNIQSDAIAEHYIEGRELYVGVMGNTRLQTFQIWEMTFNKMPKDVAPIATARVKWDPKYQKRHGIETHAAKDISPEVAVKIQRTCKRVYRALNMSGYARMDLRLRDDGIPFVIEANANPNIEFGEDFAESAEHTGVQYAELLTRIINLGLNYQASWKS